MYEHRQQLLALPRGRCVVDAARHLKSQWHEPVEFEAYPRIKPSQWCRHIHLYSVGTPTLDAYTANAHTPENKLYYLLVSKANHLYSLPPWKPRCALAHQAAKWPRTSRIAAWLSPSTSANASRLRAWLFYVLSPGWLWEPWSRSPWTASLCQESAWGCNDGALRLSESKCSYPSPH